MFRNNFFPIRTLWESEAQPSPLQKEKRGSAKSDVSKMSFPDIGKITNHRQRRHLPRCISQLRKISGPIFLYSKEFTDEFILQIYLVLIQFISILIVVVLFNIYFFKMCFLTYCLLKFKSFVLLSDPIFSREKKR